MFLEHLSVYLVIGHRRQHRLEYLHHYVNIAGIDRTPQRTLNPVDIGTYVTFYKFRDKELVKLVEKAGYGEGLPVVVDPGILNPREFIDRVLKVRVPNPFMPDTPQRIATDTSQKLAIRFGETIKSYLADRERNVNDLKMIPLVFAGWLRYLMAVDDEGVPFELSPDPLLPELTRQMAGVKLGDTDVEETIRPVLENAGIFGVNLYEAGMAERVCGYFRELNAGTGAVRSTLKKYV